MKIPNSSKYKNLSGINLLTPKKASIKMEILELERKLQNAKLKLACYDMPKRKKEK